MLEWVAGINMNIPINLMCGNEDKGMKAYIKSMRIYK